MTPPFPCRKGSAAVEFAMVLPIILTCLAVLTDFGLASLARGSLATAVATGAQYAATTGPAVNPSAIEAIVHDRLAATVTVQGPECGCISDAALAPVQCETRCPDGTRPGLYIAITARHRYTPILPFFSRLAPVDLTDTAQVRLK